MTSNKSNVAGKESGKPRSANLPLAMAVVRKQQWKNIYKHDSAFAKGTIFADLDKPWVGSRKGGVSK